MSEFPERVVYVDDDLMLRNMVRKALEDYKSDIVLVTCGNGHELLSRLRELQPELILLDMLMPEMNGPDVVEQLQRDPDGEDIPIIFVTSTNKLTMEDDYKELGVLGIIHKPFTPDELTEAMAGYWKTYIENRPVEEAEEDDEEPLSDSV